MLQVAMNIRFDPLQCLVLYKYLEESLSEWLPISRPTHRSFLHQTASMLALQLVCLLTVVTLGDARLDRLRAPPGFLIPASNAVDSVDPYVHPQL